ncbi:F-box domain-containing protein [Rhynchospora pubera]|uniref:F-box domain-containing protein n=1 Tax=Rhynchospora pubera TaxID=906938 RepID=A0AAV8DKL4_9POAL|nr:F-box domain-containing protein [Rhynchospora pubera]
MEMEMEAMNEGEEERDWACLPTDVLNHIAECLTEISDFVRFRAVCHAWRTTTTELPPYFPWILDSRQYPPDQNLTFYSLPLNKTYTIPAPKSLDKEYLQGPYSHGYLATLSQRTNRPISLLNPLTNHEIYFPVCPPVYNQQWIGPRQNQRGEHVVLSYGRLCSKSHTLFFCHPGHKNWHKLRLGSAYKNCRHFYLKGMLFSVKRRTGVMKVTNITNGTATLAYAVPPPFEGDSTENSEDYLVEDSLGDILRVSDRKYWFHVYRLDVGNKKGSSPCWVKVSDIGNQAIFIDRDGAFVLRAGELSQIKRNSIYRLKTFHIGIRAPRTYKAWREEIDTGKYERLHCPLEKPESWFVPNLHHF